MSRTALWTTFSINMLLRSRANFVDVPAKYALDVARALADELGIRVRRGNEFRGKCRLTRVASEA